VGAVHHSMASCLHPETGEACAELASSKVYDGRLDSEVMGLHLAEAPDSVPEDINHVSMLALPPLPAPSEPAPEWKERRQAALSAAKRAVSSEEPLSVQLGNTASRSIPEVDPNEERVEEAMAKLETMQSLQAELEEWQGVLTSKIQKMEDASEEEEDIATMRNELDTVQEKLAMHKQDVMRISNEIAELKA